MTIVRFVRVLLVVAVCAGCSGAAAWPDAPPVDEPRYQAEYQEWLEEQEQTAAWALPLVGMWPIDKGDTAFGSDASLPIVLPAGSAPPKAGVFTRAGDTVTVTAAASTPLRLEDGSAVTAPARVDDGTVLMLGSLRIEVVGEAPRVFVTVTDAAHPDLANLRIDTFPVDARWRVAARFEAFDTPRPVRIADTRGGFTEMLSAGQLVFRVNGVESRLTALESGGPSFFVMFKDATNGSTTYSGYRILTPDVVADGEWTVLDFNLARNPPCAYSPYTLCPLPPPENRVDTAVEAGVKRHPTADGFVG